MTDDERNRSYMKEALRLAAKGEGRTSPNPMVGAVVVRDGAVVGRGFHEFVGGPHAEVGALRDAGALASGADLYVTLEPCNHHGRTPPCTKAVLEAGIVRVFVGMGDPNPHVEGGGADFLRERGVRVEMGVLERECRLINQPFIKHMTTGAPYVTIKTAATLDGRIATRTGDARWITNEKSRRFVHHLRCVLDGILVGVGTALADDPQLTARVRKRPPCRQPARIVLDSHLRLPATGNLARTAREVPVIAACGEDAPDERAARLADCGVEIVRLPVMDGGGVDLAALLRELGGRKIMSLLVEGGARVVGSFLDQGLADDFHFFYAPKILVDAEGTPMTRGGARERMVDALEAHDLRVRRFGADVMLSGRLRKEIY